MKDMKAKDDNKFG